MIKKILANSSILLSLGYLLGQGSTFISQLIIKHYGGFELLGATTLIVSLMSFAFQFNDFGNVSYVVKTVAKRQLGEMVGFVIFRSVLGALITLVFVYQAVQVKESHLSGWLILGVPCLGLLSGLALTGLLEHEGNYKKLAFVQNFPWLLNAIFICFALVTTTYQNVVMVSWLVAAGLSLYFSWSGQMRLLVLLKNVKFRYVVTNAIVYISTPLMSQLYGRYVMLAITASYGLVMLGVFGLVRYVQVGLSLILSFWLRPIHRELSVALHHDRNLGYVSTLSRYKYPLLFSVVVVFSVVGGVQLEREYFGDEAVRWIYLLLVMPPWIIGSVSSQYISRHFSSRVFGSVDLAGLLVNFIIFQMLFRMDPLLGIAMGEGAQILFTVIFAIWLSNRRCANE